jgi:hypothetical protein
MGLRNTIKILSRITNSWSGFELNGRTSELEVYYMVLNVRIVNILWDFILACQNQTQFGT